MEYRPPVDGFDDDGLAGLLTVFAHVKLADAEAPVTVNWPYVQRTLGMSQGEAEAKLSDAEARGLLTSLTIAYDHERWMHQSADKGCLVVLVCIEGSDLARDGDDVANAFQGAVTDVRRGVISQGQYLDDLLIMPNAHLNPRGVPVTDRDACVRTLEALRDQMTRAGWAVQLNSFGYSKILELAINAHPLGYVLRVV